MANVVEVEGKKYYIERAPDFAILHPLKEMLFEGQSQYQHVEIIDQEYVGRTLFLDNVLQSTELFKDIYHEMAAHPVLLAHPNPRRVLVIGGGDGYIVKEIVRHGSVEEVVLVDIDEVVVEKSDEILHPGFRLKGMDKVRVVIMDGVKFLKENQDTFDVIIMDIPGVGNMETTEGLYTDSMYESAHRALKEDGMIAIQAEGIDPQYRAVHKNVYRLCMMYFPIVRSYMYYNPAFFSPYSIVIGSKKVDPAGLPKDELEKKTAKLGKLHYFNAEMYHCLFRNIPTYLREIYSEIRKEVEERKG